MNINSFPSSPESYAAMRSYLSEQADTLDGTLADSNHAEGDVRVTSDYFTDTAELGTAKHTSTTLTRQGDHLNYSETVENMVGYKLQERRITFQPKEDGSYMVTDFDGKNIHQTVI